MVFIWPFIHAFLAALITTWDVLPPTSKAYDLVPNHIVAKYVAFSAFRNGVMSRPLSLA
jgi:hypothetical protein